MNQQLRRTLILAGALFFVAQFIQAQTGESEYRELIVQVPGIVGTRGFPEIKSKLLALDGVHVVAFCETQQLIMLRIERKKQANNRPVFTAISDLQYRFHVKEGATISKAMDACKDMKLQVFQREELRSE